MCRSTWYAYGIGYRYSISSQIACILLGDKGAFFYLWTFVRSRDITCIMQSINHSKHNPQDHNDNSPAFQDRGSFFLCPSIESKILKVKNSSK
jgi:hypothetical protein